MTTMCCADGADWQETSGGWSVSYRQTHGRNAEVLQHSDRQLKRGNPRGVVILLRLCELHQSNVSRVCVKTPVHHRLNLLIGIAFLGCTGSRVNAETVRSNSTCNAGKFDSCYKDLSEVSSRHWFVVDIKKQRARLKPAKLKLTG